jgi:hypothetical protein
MLKRAGLKWPFWRMGDPGKTPSGPTAADSAMEWWERRRLRFNAALIASIVIAFFAYLAVLGACSDVIGAPIVDADGTIVGRDTEVGGYAAGLQCCGAVVGLLLANFCYFLGALFEPEVPAARVGVYRKWAWRLGVAFACFLPLSIPLLHVVACLFFPDSYDHAPVAP